MKKRTYNLGIISGLASVLATIVAPISGANAQDGKLEEVLVTARKRVESMQETPVAVTALSQEALRDASVRNLADLTRIVPGLNTRAGDKSAPFSIRGVGSRGNQNVARDPAVGVYLDGIFIPRTDSQLIEVMSIESVQVLRGPQGTLFGKNTAGGALLLTTQKPHEDFSGEVGVDIGNYNRQDFSGNVNLPVTDDLFLRITADSRKRDGYMDDEYTGIDYGNVNTWALAAQVRWLPSDNLTLDILAFTSEQDENAAPQTCELARVGTNLQAFTVPGDSRAYPEACLESAELNGDDKVSMDAKGVPWQMDSTVLGLTADWEVGEGNIRSITGYLAQDNIITARDQDASSVFTITNVSLLLDQYQWNDIEHKQKRSFLSQEFQYISAAFDDQLEYTIGLFYSKEDIDDSPQGFPMSEAGFMGIPGGDPLGTLVNVFPPSLVGFRTNSLSDFDNETLAAFAQGTWHFDESWSLTVGGRYGEEEKKVKQQNIVSATLSPGVVTREEFDSLGGTVHDLVQLNW